MFDPHRQPRIAVLGLSLDLYDRVMPGYMARLNRQLARFVTPMKPFADVVGKRLCWRQEHVAQAIRQAEQSDVDALVLVPLCYTASGMTLAPAVQTRLPLVVWNTQELETIGENFNVDDVLMNHATQGTQDVTHVLLRTGRMFGMESGHHRDAAALARLGDWLVAARVQRLMRSCRVGLLGHPFQDMKDFAVDDALLTAKWGPQVIHLGLAEFARNVAEARPAEIARLKAADRKTYAVDRNVTAEIHRYASRLEAALRRLVAEHRLDAFSMNFLNLIEDGRFATLPFLGLNKLLGEGLGYAGEGDAVTAAHMAQMRLLCGAANFTEIFTVDYLNNRLLMMHMQECNPALARHDRPVRLVRKDFWAPGIRPYVGMVFSLEPGPVTLSCLIPDGAGSFRYLVYETRIKDAAPLPKLDVPHWIIQLDESVGEFLTRYSMAGGPHHLVATPGHSAQRLARLARWQGFALTPCP